MRWRPRRYFGIFLMPRHKKSNAPHPLCPYCDYDMVGAVNPLQPRMVRCPECGEQIEPHEFARTRQQGEWTELIGLRNALISIAARVIVTAAVWAGLLLLMDSGLTTILGPSGMLSLRVMFIPLAICAMIFGWIMQWKLDEHAGFHSWLIIWIAAASTFAALQLGQAAANAMFALNYLTQSAWSVMTGMAAAVVIVYIGYQQD